MSDEPDELFAARLGLDSSNRATAPVTNTVAAEVPSTIDQVPSLLITGTPLAGATISGFLLGSWRGKIIGNRLPLLSPIDDPLQ